MPDTTVQNAVNRRAVWVGPNSKQKVLVSVTPNSPLQDFRQGQKVDVSGTATKPHGDDRVQQSLGLSVDDEHQLKSDGVFLEAASVASRGQIPTNQAQNQNQNQ